MTPQERQTLVRLAADSAALAQLAYERVISGHPDAAATTAMAAEARRTRLAIVGATGAEADAWVTAILAVSAPELAADLTPATTVAVAGGVL